MFEATHGTAPDLAGTNQANPLGVMLSGAMLLRHVGELDAGDRLESAIVGRVRRRHAPAGGPARAR